MNSTGDFCQECAKENRVSRYSVVQFPKITYYVCSSDECPSEKVEGYTEYREEQDSKVPLHAIKASKLPITLCKEPRLKLRHMKTLEWLHWLGRGHIYFWLQIEVNSLDYLIHSLNKTFKYTPTPSVRRLLALTKEEIQIGKHVIPDLEKILICLKRKIRLYKNFLKGSD